MPARSHHPGLAFLYAVPISLLGGLIGLGGAEFRLPVLAGPLRYSARQVVPLNLAISLVTLVVALITRGRTLSFATLIPFLPAIGALIAGAVVTAFIGVLNTSNRKPPLSSVSPATDRRPSAHSAVILAGTTVR
jgi:uncharacterized membrane protein YfcA